MTAADDLIEMMISVRKRAGNAEAESFARAAIAAGFAVIRTLRGPRDAADTADRILTVYVNEVLGIRAEPRARP